MVSLARVRVALYLFVSRESKGGDPKEPTVIFHSSTLSYIYAKGFTLFPKLKLRFA